MDMSDIDIDELADKIAAKVCEKMAEQEEEAEEDTEEESDDSYANKPMPKGKKKMTSKDKSTLAILIGMKPKKSGD